MEIATFVFSKVGLCLSLIFGKVQAILKVQSLLHLIACSPGQIFYSWRIIKREFALRFLVRLIVFNYKVFKILQKQGKFTYCIFRVSTTVRPTKPRACSRALKVFRYFRCRFLALQVGGQFRITIIVFRCTEF
jgi:hypothetical protein